MPVYISNVWIKRLIVCLIAGRLAAKIARKESLSLKLALRPDRQELINRNILQLQTDNERQETKEAIGAKLIRWKNILSFFLSFYLEAIYLYMDR